MEEIKLEFEKQHAEIKLRKEDKKIEIERASLKMQEKRETDIASRLKKYADALRGAILKQTNDPLEVVTFFRNVERLFEDFKVPDDLQAAVIRPFLTNRSKMLIARLDPSKSSVYKEIKTAVLREYKVSAPMYRDKFNNLGKSDDQTFVMYVSSLFSLINGYLESRKVTNLSQLKDLLVSDRVKATLKPHIFKYVLPVEANSTQGWLPPYETADVIDD